MLLVARTGLDTSGNKADGKGRATQYSVNNCGLNAPQVLGNWEGIEIDLVWIKGVFIVKLNWPRSQA